MVRKTTVNTANGSYVMPNIDQVYITTIENVRSAHWTSLQPVYSGPQCFSLFRPSQQKTTYLALSRHSYDLTFQLKLI